jgi:hypothetical protein
MLGATIIQHHEHLPIAFQRGLSFNYAVLLVLQQVVGL